MTPRRSALAVAMVAAALLLPLSDRVFAQDAQRAADLARQAVERLRAGDAAGGMRLAEEAVRAAPEHGAGYGARGYARFRQGERSAAIEDYARGVELDPANPQWRLFRTQCYMSMDHWRAAFEDADAGWKATQSPPFLSLRGWSRINLGEVDQGLADMDQAVAAAANQPGMYNRFDGYFFKADWQAAVDEAKRFDPYGMATPPHAFFTVRALCELGKFDEARQAVEGAERKFGTSIEPKLARAYLHGSAGAGALHDADKAVAVARSCQAPQSLAHTTNTLGRALVLAGRHHEAVQELESHGRLTNFDTLFLLGVANFRIGRLAEARRTFTEAQRLNPYAARHAERHEGVAEFLKGIGRTLEAEKTVDRRALGAEQETEALSLSELETLVRRFQFGRAAKEYERYLGTLQSPVRKREAEDRLAAVRGLAGALDKLARKVNAGQLKDFKVKAGGMDVTLTRAPDAETFEYSFAKGSGKGSWAGLGIDAMLQALEKSGPSVEEGLAIGMLAWDFGQREKAFDLLARGAKEAKLRPRLDAFLSARLGVPAPEGGFLAHKGRWITPDEKAQYDQGLVPFEGQWVTPADREKMARGLARIGDKWMPRDEAELLRRGYKKYKDKWYPRDEYELLRGKWENAFTLASEHYDIRTNESEEFAAELARVAEATWLECRELYGGKEPKLPGKERMTLWAFGTFEDYRRHCAENGHMDHLQAGGFAVSNSNVVVGWDKTDNRQMFLQTMAHEAAHLYYFRVAPAANPPSWYAEGMATQLEGFKWDGAGYVFDRRSAARLPFVQRAANDNTHLPLETLLAGDALKLINSNPDQALLFYAQSWAFFYYLTQTSNEAYRKGFEEFRASLDAGRSRSLKDLIPDLAGLEKDFVKFVRGM